MISLRKKSPPTERPPGVLLLQIDGLSRFQFERAIRTGRMPYLRTLLESGIYQLKSFYPGLPSCTPAVQAELHYGKPCATPAFSFFDRDTGSEVRMYDAEWARRISKESRESGDGLLEGGSSYANIYTGEASNAKYCGEVNTFAHWAKELSPLRLIRRAFRYPRSAFRILKLIVAEFGIGIYDAIRGIQERGELAAELKFIPARVGVSIALREAICGEVIDDLKAGVPIAHANFFGYDEAAHRRGPQSLFALWSLRGIDQSLRRLIKAAKRSQARDYKVIVFSDHGQEHTTPYSELTGKSLKQNVHETLSKLGDYHIADVETLHAAMERAKAYLRELESESPQSTDWEAHNVYLQAMGPVAHLSCREPLSAATKRRWANALSQQCQIPYILYLDTDNQIACVTPNSNGDLSLLKAKLVERGHRFPDEAINDMEELVRSKYSGDLVFLGWRSEKKPLTFAEERGAHGGPGAEECRGFAMLPRSANYVRGWLRPLDLRQITFELMGKERKTSSAVSAPQKEPHELRVLCYNVHGGVGVDRKRNQDRLAAVIRESDADVICFQEAFEGIEASRKSLRDSVSEAWQSASFDFEFLALHQSREYRFGLAIASKRQFTVRKSRGFDLAHPRTVTREPRGAIWVEIEESHHEGSIHIVNTHFGLQSLERRLQAEALVGEHWLKGIDDRRDRIVVCGDLNTGPRGAAYQTIARHYADTQLVAENGRPMASFLSWAPIRRIDHIFATKNTNVSTAGVHRSPLSKWASDHLPVFADFQPRNA